MSLLFEAKFETGSEEDLRKKLRLIEAGGDTGKEKRKQSQIP
jgi:hypothetical protein